MKFELFGRLKKKESEAQKPVQQAQPAPMPQRTSVEDRVIFLVSQGLAEPEIIKILKDEGYSFQEIDSGISNILRSRVTDEQVSPSGFPGNMESPAEDLAPMTVPGDPESAPQQKQADMVEQMDALMEQMMEEKLLNVAAEFDRISSRFDEIDEKFQKIAARINELEASEKKTDEQAEAEIQEVSSKETNLEPRIASLEKAFKDIIPGLVESIRELRSMAASRKRDVPVQETELGVPEDAEEPVQETGKGSNIFD